MHVDLWPVGPVVLESREVGEVRRPRPVAAIVWLGFPFGEAVIMFNCDDDFAITSLTDGIAGDPIAVMVPSVITVSTPSALAKSALIVFPDTDVLKVVVAIEHRNPDITGHG